MIKTFKITRIENDIKIYKNNCDITKLIVLRSFPTSNIASPFMSAKRLKSELLSPLNLVLPQNKHMPSTANPMNIGNVPIKALMMISDEL